MPKNEALTPRELVSDLADIVENVVQWPRVDWAKHRITISEMATISARVEKLLEQRCHDVSIAVEQEESGGYCKL